MSQNYKRSVYVCHTYYHVYVSFLKELAKPIEEQGHATLILSTMSNDFENLDERIKALDYFEDVLIYNEVRFPDIPEVNKYHHPSKSFLVSIWNRFLFTKKYGKSQEKLVPVDFKTFDDIYVYCDLDPIGYYLNYKHIYYHSVEDGLDSLVYTDSARRANESHFELKAFLSKKCNIIFVHNGYGKYCLDMEVNDPSRIKRPCPYYIGVSRAKLTERLTAEDKRLLSRAFIKEIDKLNDLVNSSDTKTAMILTEPLCSLDVRKQLFTDLIDEYKDEYSIIIKQHPRDELDYALEFPDVTLVDRTVPMEMLNFIEGFHVDLVISVFTVTDSIKFADKSVRLGASFMDKYEDVSMHSQKYSSIN